MSTTTRLAVGQIRILPGGTRLTLLRPSTHRGEWVVQAPAGAETRQGASLRRLPFLKGRIVQQANGWRVWISDATGTADWGTYRTRDEARDALRDGLAKS